MILESKNIEYEAIDIAEPGKEAEKEFMQQNSKAKDSKYALPPQIFNEEEYCGVSILCVRLFALTVKLEEKCQCSWNNSHCLE